MANVAICIPSQDTWKAPTAAFVAASAQVSERAGHRITIISHERSIISEGRNDIVRAVLEIGGHDYIFWVDSDIVGNAAVLNTILEHEREIVGVRYMRRSPPNDLLGELFEDQESDPSSPLRLAKTIPGGCTLVSTKVYERLKYPWYFIVNGWAGDDGAEAMSHQIFQTLPAFAPSSVREKMEELLRSDNDVAKFLEDGRKWFDGKPRVIGEDAAFCKKARMFGYQILADESLKSQIGHLATVPLIYSDEPRDLSLEE